MSCLFRLHRKFMRAALVLLPVFLLGGVTPAWANGTGGQVNQPPVAAGQAQIALAKRAGEAQPNGDGSFSATIELRVQNVGGEPLKQVQIIDDIQALIAPADVLAIESLRVTGDLSEVDPRFDGIFETNLLSGTEQLRVGGEAIVSFTLVFNPNGEPGPFFNKAKAVARGNDSGKITFDGSQNGADPDPDTPGNRPADNPEPTDDSEPTPIVLPPLPQDPALGLAKRLSGLEETLPGVFEATFELLVKNLGDVKITNLQIRDDLELTFMGATDVTVTRAPTAIGGLTVNPDYDGISDANLLRGRNFLLPGARAGLSFTVSFRPDGVYEFLNSAEVIGLGNGEPVTDLSDDGTEPDSNGNGRADDPGEDDPTPIIVPEPQPTAQLGAAKTATDAVATERGFMSEVTITLVNLGATNLQGLSVTEDLATTLGAAELIAVTDLAATGALVVNPGFDGLTDTNLLDPASSLDADASAQISFRLVFAPADDAGELLNQVLAGALAPDGTTVEDFSTNGTNPDPNGDGRPDEAEPTPIRYATAPAVGLAKAASAVDTLADGRYAVTFRLVIENLGDVAVRDLAISDDLNATFGDVPYVVQAPPAASDLLTANPAFDGAADQVLARAGSLPAGAVAEVTFTVEFGPLEASREFTNSALVVASTRQGEPLTDRSTDGEDPDPNGDGVADESEPTPFAVDVAPALPIVGVAKLLEDLVPVAEGSRITLRFTIENLSDVPAPGVQLNDNLRTTFGEAAVITVIEPPVVSGALTQANALYDGTDNTELLSGEEMLPAAGAAQVLLTADISGVSGDFLNSARVSATDASGTEVASDLSDDGTEVDANGNGFPADADENDPTPITLPPVTQTPLLGLAKSVSSVETLGADVFAVTLLFTIANLGTADATGVQLTDSLDATFGDTPFAVTSVESADFVVNPGFDGVADTNLLSGADVLSAGASGSVTLALEIRPAETRTFTNSAVIVDDSGGDDTSTEGDDPDPDGDGNPGNNDVPTLIELPADPGDTLLGLAKSASPVEPSAADTFATTLTFTLVNLGDVDLSQVQVTDNLAAVFGETPFSVAGPVTTSEGLAANPDFDGVADTNLLDAEQSSLAAGASATVSILITFSPDPAGAEFFNLATAGGETPDGTEVTDTSTDGTNPDPNGDGNPDEAEPTPIVTGGANGSTAIGSAKALLESRALGNQAFELTFGFVLENLDRERDATFVQVTDDLAAAFPRATIEVLDVRVTSGVLTLNGAYDGVTETRLLSGSDTLRAGERATLELSLRVTLADDEDLFFNQAEITTADSQDGAPVAQDLSDDGTEPDSNGNQIADDEGEDDPTPVRLSANAVLGVAKSVASIQALDANRFSVAFLLNVENLGDVTVDNVQVSEDLPAAFPEPAVVSVSAAPAVTGALTGANANFDGAADTNLLAPGNGLAPGERGTITFTIVVALNGSTGPFANQVVITGESPDGDPGEDPSAPGNDPDPDGDGDPGGPGEDAPTPVDFPAGLIGTVFSDLNTNQRFDEDEPRLAGWTVELLDADGQLVAVAITGADGTYQFLDRAPGDYTVRFRHPEINVTWGERAAELIANGVTVVDFPVAPSGRFYGAVDRELVPGVTVALTDADGTLLPSACLLPGQQSQTVGSDAAYRFDINPGANAACPDAAREYVLQIVAVPDLFAAGVSALIPPAGTLDTVTCPIDGNGEPPCVIQPQDSPPQGMDDTTYYTRWSVDADGQTVVHNHIPLDLPAAGATLSLVSVTKTAAQATAVIGDLVTYDVTVVNLTPNALDELTLVDDLPAGFQWVPDSQRLIRAGADGEFGTLDDVEEALGSVGIDPVELGPFMLAGGERVRLRYYARVSTGVTRGEYVNTVTPIQNGTQIGNRALAAVEIVADPIFEQTTIVGKVFHDKNEDGWQDDDEPGIAGVRLATVGGLLIETDGSGRYHIADIDVPRFERGRNFILKLDTATLPDGAEVISENPRVIRVTQALMSRLNFAVKLPEQAAPSPLQPPTRYIRTETRVLRGLVQPVSFESGKSYIPATYAAQLNDTLKRYRDYKNLRLKFVGHTDNEPLSPRAAAIYGDNQGLSEARARQVKDLVVEELERLRAASDESGQIKSETEGHADRRPIASNESRAGMALNRRVEIEILFDQDVEKTELVTDEAVEVGEFPTFATDVLALTAYFAEGADVMSADQRKVLADRLGDVGEEQNLVVEVVGHTDVPTGDSAADLAISQTRATHVAQTLAELLDLPVESIAVSARGADEPVADNETVYGRRLNRRVEIRVQYDYVEKISQVSKAPVQDALPVDPVALAAGGRLWLTEDPLIVEPRLDVVADTHVVVDDAGALTDPLDFSGYTNYASFVERYQLDIYDAADTDFVRPLASWQGSALDNISIPEFSQPLAAEQSLVYVIRAYDAAGHEDATHARSLRVVADNYGNVVRETPGRIWGQNNLARQVIPVAGSRIRVNGSALADVDTVIVNERTIPLDRQGRFAAEFQAAEGRQVFNVSGLRAGTPVWQQALETEVDDNYTFFVALANITAGQQDLSGDFESLAGDDHFDESVFVDGRLAFYAKAKIKGKYLLTAQLDSTEDELSEFSDNLRREDPRRVFRQLDPNRYYAVYGDDSTTVSDVDSQGAFYLRLDWDRNQLLWGNFNTGLTDTEFAQYNRSLYGAKGSHASQAQTRYGDARTRANVFASEAQSAAAHVTFRATGGSLYYLKHTDIVQGSEKVWVEVRQRDTEQVIERQEYIAGRDYEIDPLQGRIILSRPLSQVVNDRAGTIIRTDALEGDDVFLLVDYEYVPAGFDAEDMTYGGRAQTWLGDHVGVGVSKVVDERDGTDFDLQGVDLTLKAGKGTYISAEVARSDARQHDAGFGSADGGLSFTDQNGSGNGDTLSGDAIGIEARVNLGEVSDTLKGDVRAWHKNRDAEFSNGRLREGLEVTDQGVEAKWQPADGIALSSSYTDLEEDGRHHTKVARVQADVKVDRLTIGGEVRHEDIVRESLSPGLQSDGEGLLAGARLGYALNERQTLYAALQTGLDEEGDYEDNDLVTVGVNTRMSPHTAMSLEAVDGDRGSALVGGLDFSPADRLDFNVKGGVGSGALNGFTGSYQLAEGHELYGSYTVDPDRTDGARELLTIGQRRDAGNRLGVFTESQFGKDDRYGGVNHAFGLDFDTDAGWVLSSLLQYSENDTDANAFERMAASLGATLKRDRLKFASKLEYRADEGALVDSRQYLLSTSATYIYSDHRRWLGQLNLSWTDDEISGNRNARFVEFDLGHAYRPVNGDRWNVLTKYSYFYDLVSVGQSVDRPDQDVHILSTEALYRVNARWELGGKVALKEGRLRAGRDMGPWEDYGVGLGVLRARYHLTHRWDGLIEYRYLHDRFGESTRHGSLIGLYRHIGEHMKLGIGYNFTDFNDDLKDAEYDNHGWFVDLIGKW